MSFRFSQANLTPRLTDTSSSLGLQIGELIFHAFISQIAPIIVQAHAIVRRLGFPATSVNQQRRRPVRFARSCRTVDRAVVYNFAILSNRCCRSPKRRVAEPDYLLTLLRGAHLAAKSETHPLLVSLTSPWGAAFIHRHIPAN